MADHISFETESANIGNAGLNVLSQVNEMNDTTFNINSLPEDVFLKIFGYLDLEEVSRVGRVCKKWYIITRYPLFWRRVDVQLCFPRCPNMKLVKILPSCVTHMSLDFKYWPFMINFSKLSMELQSRCPNLETLILRHAQFTDTFLSFISAECLEYIKTLVLHISALSFATRKDTKKKNCVVSKIVVLDLNGCADSIDFKLFPLDMPNLSMPHLKKLRLANLCMRSSWFKDHRSLIRQLEFLDLGRTKICISTPFQIIRDYGLHLIVLYLCHSDIRDEDLTFNDSEKVFPQLQEICFSGCIKVTLSGAISFIQSCSSLKRIFVGSELTKHLRVDLKCLEHVRIYDPCCHTDLHYLQE